MARKKEEFLISTKQNLEEDDKIYIYAATDENKMFTFGREADKKIQF